MKPIPSFRASHLLPYTQFLRKIGAPVEHGLRQAKLPIMLTDQSGAYLPLMPALTFLTRMDRSQGIDDLGLRAVQGMKVTDLSECFVEVLRRSPTLLTALESFQDLSHLDDPNLHFCFTPQGTNVKLNCLNRMSLDTHGQRYDDWGNLLGIIAIVRAYAGPAWHPKEMAFHSNLPLSPYASEQFPHTRFLIGQKAAWITVPRDLLHLPQREGRGAASARLTSKPKQASIEEATLDFPASLRRILTTYLCDGYPSIELAAELAGTSIRSLQRRLQQHDTNYSALVRQARFECASTLLCDTDARIIDIALEVGYEEPTHFTRAFRRIAGICPRQYRFQQRLH